MLHFFSVAYESPKTNRVGVNCRQFLDGLCLPGGFYQELSFLLNLSSLQTLKLFFYHLAYNFIQRSAIDKNFAVDVHGVRSV